MVVELAQQVINGLVLGGIYALVALGLTMLYGILGIVNWAHGEFYMLGAFAGFCLVVDVGLSFWLGLLGALIVMGLLGVVLELLVLRPLRQKPHINTILGTLGLSIFILNVSLLIWGAEPRRFPAPFSEVITISGVSATGQRLIVLIVATICILMLHFVVTHTKAGKAMRACEQDMEAANLMGIEVNYIAMLTVALSASLAGVAGTLVGPIFLVYPQMSIQAVLKAFVVVIVGGLGNIKGAIFAGLLVGLAESFTAGFISSYFKEIVTFGILLLTLIIRPEGLFGGTSVEKV